MADNERELKVEELALAPLVFLDDIGNLAEDTKAAQEANDRIETMVETKQLSLNLDKSSFMIIGNSKARNKIKIQ